MPRRRERMPSDRRLRRTVAVWDTPGFTKKLSSQQLAEKRLSEIKNGRLAMIGMVSFLIGHNLPGSVPALTSAF